jgi:hypothetical protein
MHEEHNLDCSNKIHIVFNSREDQRVTSPILTYKPNKLYYFLAKIKSTGQNDTNLDYFEKNTTLLREKIPGLEIIPKEIDYTDYIEVIQELSKIIKKERQINPNSEIIINIGTGSNITALASSEAARLWKCKIFYVYSTEYSPSTKGPRHKGEMITIVPQLFPLRRPKTKFIKVLKLIDNAITQKYENKTIEIEDKFLYKKNLLELLVKEGFLKLRSKHENLRSRKASYYMKLNQRFLKPMTEELNYIKISDHKRNKKIFITNTGRIVLEIFKFLI